jgi:hypothetical protein
MASEIMLLNDLPDELLLKIFSHFGAEELSLVIARVCKGWNILANDVALWKTVWYKCDDYSDISHFKEVRCTTLLEFSTNILTNVGPSSVLKVQNLKEHFRNWPSFHPE